MKLSVPRKTDQWNNEDLEHGPRVFTVSHVTYGKEQAPYDIHFSDGDGKCWRPSNGMLEVLIKVWGNESQAWSGRRVELYQDRSVKMGRDVVGGIRVRAMSHIDGPQSPRITVSRGTKKPFTVQPLPDAPDPLEAIRNARDMDELRAAWEQAKTMPGATEAKDKRKQELA